MASSIATRDAALFLPYRSAFRSLNNIIGLPILLFHLMGREIAVEHQDSVSITCLLPAYRTHIILSNSLILHDLLLSSSRMRVPAWVSTGQHRSSSRFRPFGI